MSALSFKKQFAQDVESGKKRQTIRAIRKDFRKIKPGEKLYLYTGMRTKGCRKLKESDCISVRHFRMITSTTWTINGKLATDAEQVQIAEDDGFTCVVDMVEFFRDVHGLPFEGHIINW